jgi:hypothetical protein
VHILATMILMEDALAAEDAPRRQIQGVHGWSSAVANAVVAGHACGSTAGMDAEPAWSGAITHRRWVGTCQMVISALRTQEATAAALYSAAMAAARSANTEGVRNAALARARKAAAWRSAAVNAETVGVGLVAREDAILRPVGMAIAAAGGISEVANDKHYHQGRGRR